MGPPRDMLEIYLSFHKIVSKYLGDFILYLLQIIILTLASIRYGEQSDVGCVLCLKR